ncbi:unnamed protein product [Moneuplotes crassus]|uniref:Regulator of telomere elongation helicase 1 homolog n=1 Tax=Euplotes crassus TaxID=5936 RepID=A0AAD1UQQ6_EUPCR|nr:unnamed protein product [Moneuplotes crassus]
MSTVKIWDYEIKFPYQRYDIQFDYMIRVIKACHKAENALLESPTGTGKTLCVLCAALAWLDREIKQVKDKKLAEDSGLRVRPKVIYCSRTHSQLNQVMNELKETEYYPRTSLMASRDHMCIHPDLKKLKGQSINTACKHATSKGFNDFRCFKKKNAERYQEKEQKYETWGIQDIEDLHKFGTDSDVCPYFLSRERLKSADLILIPYNYLLDEKIRANLEINFKNSIVIIDEAHNILERCESVSSVDLNEAKLESIFKEIASLKSSIENQSGATTNKNNSKQISFTTKESECIQIQTLVSTMLKNLQERALKRGKWEHFKQKEGFLVSKFENIFKILPDLTRNKEQRSMDEFTVAKDQTEVKINPEYEEEKQSTISTKHEVSDEATKKLDEVNEGNISHWIELISRAIQDSLMITRKEKKGNLNLEDLSKALTIIYKIWKKRTAGGSTGLEEAQCDISEDFHICITQEVSQKKSSITNFGIWCTNPGFSFKDIEDLGVRSIILTSGTLSPMDSFAVELQSEFPIQLENSHVIKPKQVCMGVLPRGINGNEFTFTYTRRDDAKMLQDLGESISKIAQRCPDGMLIFFPSYFLMEKCSKIWNEYNCFSELEGQKKIYKEPKISAKFASVMNHYEADLYNGKGAILMGVCRGKVSEGIDFSDRAARCVIIIGMPFAQFKDPKIVLKKEYLERKYAEGKSHISGRDWYNQECSRAVNQAIGRVIRHINDYGLILLVDRRYGDRKAIQERSKWLRERQVTFESFDEAFDTIEGFFEEMTSLKLSPKTMKPPKFLRKTQSSQNGTLDKWTTKSSNIAIKSTKAKQNIIHCRSKSIMPIHKPGIRSFITSSAKRHPNRPNPTSKTLKIPQKEPKLPPKPLLSLTSPSNPPPPSPYNLPTLSHSQTSRPPSTSLFQRFAYPSSTAPPPVPFHLSKLQNSPSQVHSLPKTPTPKPTGQAPLAPLQPSSFFIARKGKLQVNEDGNGRGRDWDNLHNSNNSVSQDTNKPGPITTKPGPSMSSSSGFHKPKLNSSFISQASRRSRAKSKFNDVWKKRNGGF